MSFSYDAALAPSSSLSWIRLRIADTSSSSAKFEDEEIQVFIDEQGDKYLAAAVACETLGAQFAGKVDKTIGRLRISMSQASLRYFTLADRLRAELAAHSGAYVGGISVGDKQDAETDSDRVKPAFETGQFAFPGTAEATTWGPF